MLDAPTCEQTSWLDPDGGPTQHGDASTSTGTPPEPAFIDYGGGGLQHMAMCTSLSTQQQRLQEQEQALPPDACGWVEVLHQCQREVSGCLDDVVGLE